MKKKGEEELSFGTIIGLVLFILLVVVIFFILKGKLGAIFK